MKAFEYGFLSIEDGWYWIGTRGDIETYQHVEGFKNEFNVKTYEMREL